MTQADYVRHSGLSKGQVSKLVAKGMPMTSAAAADAWRGSTARRHPPSLPRTAAESTAKVAPDAAREATPEAGPYRPPEVETKAPDPQAIMADSPQGAYERQRSIERAAYALAVRALKAGANDGMEKVKTHAQAVRSLLAVKQDVLDLAERERQLVAGDWVRNAMTRHDGVIAALARAMPNTLAARISPHDPEHARAELSRWVEDVFLKALHETDPWKE